MAVFIRVHLWFDSFRLSVLRAAVVNYTWRRIVALRILETAAAPT